MKKSDIYELVIKLLGIYLFITYLLSVVTSVAHGLEYEVSNQTNNIVQPNLTALLVFDVFVKFFIVLLALFLIFKTNYITKKILTVNDYEENIKLFADKKIIYEIALLITGGIIVIWTLPDFADRLYDYIYLKKYMFVIHSPDKDFLITSTIRLFLALIVVIYAKPIAAYFDRSTIVTTKSDG
jgi:hypothetical protein